MTDGWQWLRWRWPREVPEEGAQASLLALQTLSAPGRSRALLLEVAGTEAGIEHRLRIPRDRAAQVLTQLRQALPGAVVESISEPPAPMVVRAATVRLSTGRRVLAVERTEQVAAGLLAVLEDLGSDEQVLIQWWLGPPRAPISLPSGASLGEESPLAQLWSALTGRDQRLDAATRRALLDKQGRPGWRLAGRLAVNPAAAARGRLAALTAALRGAQAPGVRVGARTISARAVAQRRVPRRLPVLANVAELVALAALPIGEPGTLPVPRSGHRLLPVDRTVPESGWTLGRGTHGRTQRPVAISAADRLRHLHVLGPTGVGKSTVLLNLISQDLAAGRPLVVIEPKGDLVAEVLARVPAGRRDDVVVLDPTDTERPVGLNPLQLGSGISRELAVDHLVAAFKSLFADSWGPRTQDLLTAGLLTLSQRPEMTLAALPAVFTDAGLRRRLRSELADPVALESFWGWYEGLSENQRASVLAPLMNKLRAFLLRPTVRRVVAQSHPRLDLSGMLAGRGVVLVDLCRGRIGPEAAGLLGSLIFAHLWQTLRQRAGGPPLGIYIDEFQDYLHLPTDAADMLAQSRSLGVGLVLAHQHLGQLPTALRTAVLANAGSRVAFQLDYDDAHTLARGRDELEPADLMGLGAFEAYAQLSAAGSRRPFASIKTLPPPEACSEPDELRRLSRQRYGLPAEEVEAAWQDQSPAPPEGPIGAVARRDRGGTS